MANPRRVPNLMNKVCNKETNVWQKYKIRMEFEPMTSRTKSQYITTELKRILPNAVVRYCI